MSPILSYSTTNLTPDNFNLFNNRSIETALADDMMDVDNNGGSPNRIINQTNDESADNALYYISLGINISYAISHRFNIISGVGRECHFGNQSFLQILTAVNNSSLTAESITIAHRDTYYINVGMAYNLNEKFTLDTRYRYVPHSLINITDNLMRSSKASLSLRYNF